MATKRKVGGYAWREAYNTAMRLHTQVQQELAEINRHPQEVRGRLPDLSLMVAQSRAAVLEMAAIAEGNDKLEEVTIEDLREIVTRILTETEQPPSA